MTKSYEFQGKNVDKALERASDELSIPVDKIRHEVVTYGSTGIFGLVGVKKAIIKVFIEEEKEAVVGSAEVRPTEKKVSEPPIEANIDIENADDEHAYEEIISYGLNALQNIVDNISEAAHVEAKQKKDAIYFFISGGESGVLIGKRGQTLEAIQYLLEKMINKKSTKRVRIMVDVEGYLEKRKANLQQMATRLAAKARKINKPVTIGQMNAHDRRIVHIHLKDESGVRTQSIGDGYYRKLMIFPKKQVGSKRRNNI